MTKARSEKEEQVVTEESRPSEPDPKMPEISLRMRSWRNA